MLLIAAGLVKSAALQCTQMGCHAQAASNAVQGGQGGEAACHLPECCITALHWEDWVLSAAAGVQQPVPTCMSVTHNTAREGTDRADWPRPATKHEQRRRIPGATHMPSEHASPRRADCPCQPCPTQARHDTHAICAWQPKRASCTRKACPAQAKELRTCFSSMAAHCTCQAPALHRQGTMHMLGF